MLIVTTQGGSIRSRVVEVVSYTNKLNYKIALGAAKAFPIRIENHPKLSDCSESAPYYPNLRISSLSSTCVSVSAVAVVSALPA